ASLQLQTLVNREALSEPSCVLGRRAYEGYVIDALSGLSQEHFLALFLDAPKPINYERSPILWQCRHCTRLYAPRLAPGTIFKIAFGVIETEVFVSVISKTPNIAANFSTLVVRVLTETKSSSEFSGA
ncbi:hypothetical protein OAW26_02120, partial [Luminiphilus sp.]|nr:hypothetical protein [Luminiphilus sp.]